MTVRTLIQRSLRFHWRAHLGVVLGAAIGSAALIGALIVGVSRSGLALSGAEVLWQEFAVGCLIIIAVALDQWIRKVSA